MSDEDEDPEEIEREVNMLAAKHLKYAKDCAKNFGALLPSRDGMPPVEAMWESFAHVMREPLDPEQVQPPPPPPPPAGSAEAAAAAAEPTEVRPWLCNTIATQNEAAGLRSEWVGRMTGPGPVGPGGGAGRAGRVHQSGISFQKEMFHSDLELHSWRNKDARQEKKRLKKRVQGAAVIPPPSRSILHGTVVVRCAVCGVVCVAVLPPSCLCQPSSRLAGCSGGQPADRQRGAHGVTGRRDQRQPGKLHRPERASA